MVPSIQAWATRLASRIGSTFGYLLVGLGVLSLFLGRFSSGLWLIVIGMFLHNAARNSYQQLAMRQALEGQLVQSPASLVLVSHDRAFINNVATSTLVFEGNGRVVEYVGGYDDWLRWLILLAELIMGSVLVLYGRRRVRGKGN
mgnify:CR=1 FL=1